MSKQSERHRIGELRPSQLLFTFGVGSTIELPHLSVLQMGLDDWEALRCPEVEEPRLLRAVQRTLRPRTIFRLRRPPPQPDSDTLEAQRIGVPVSLFPRWLRCPNCQIVAPVNSGIFVLKPNLYRPDRIRYVHENCLKNRALRPPNALPARYLVACERGHLEDFPWDFFLHGGRDCPGPLRVFEVGVSGSNNELYAKCDTCEVQKPLAAAFERPSPLGPCSGLHFHLRQRDSECNAPLRPVLVGASNSWFPIRISVLSIPNMKDPVGELVEAHREMLQDCESEREIALVKKAIPALAPYSAADIFLRLKQPPKATAVAAISEGIREPEWRLFCQPSKAPTNRDLTLRQTQVPPGFEPWLEQIVLADRLREVHALVGFTRLESPEEFGDPDDIPADRKAPLSRGRVDWVPAAEIRGEGIFLRFRSSALRSWSRQTNIVQRENALFRAHQSWRRMRRLPAPDRGFPGIEFALIHTFAHALMRQLTLECGYSASSIRERIYFNEDDDSEEMAGVLIYTAAPDCDGTLGGLVSLGETSTLGQHLHHMLEEARVCSSDPLCADHVPDQSGLDIHGASCHACLFAPETSCERGNRYLDRCLLVDTLNEADLAFFGKVYTEPVAEPTTAPPSLIGPDQVLLPVGQGLPVYSVSNLQEPEGSRFSKEGEEGLFWLQIPDDSLNKIIPRGTWCLFRKLTPDDPRPEDDTLCLVETSEGAFIRRFFFIEFEDSDKQRVPTRVLLRPRSTEKYKTLEMEISPEEWTDWRPFAQFVRLEELDEA